MNSEHQDESEEKVTIRKNTQCLVQNRKDKSSSNQNLIEEINTEEPTELFYSKKIKAIQLKYTILKIISLGCFNNLINKQLKSKIKPWLDELNELQKKNHEEMLKANEWIEQAERIIENSKQKFAKKIVVEQKDDNNDELFEDALDNQPWLELKEMNVSEKYQQVLVDGWVTLYWTLIT